MATMRNQPTLGKQALPESTGELVHSPSFEAPPQGRALYDKFPEASTQIRLLMKPRDAANALAISERSLWDLTRRGIVRCVRLGRSVRYSLDDLRSFVDAQG